MSFRFFQPGTQFFSNDGQVLSGGSLSFFESGTTTPKDTYSDPTLTTPNPNPVSLDGAGRPSNDIWGDGSYRVVLNDAGGVTLVTLDNVSGPQGIPDPSLQAGKFLTNDGTDLEWESILQVPDPTGSANGDVLTTDGAGNIDWQTAPKGLIDLVTVPPGHPLTAVNAESVTHVFPMNAHQSGRVCAHQPSRAYVTSRSGQCGALEHGSRLGDLEHRSMRSLRALTLPS